MRVSATPMVLLVRDDAQWETFDEWLEWVLDNPGEFTYGSSGRGNPGNIAMETLAAETGAEFTHIAFDGQSAVFADLLGGHIDGSSGSAGDGSDLVEEGELRLLVNLGSVKDGWFKDAPTLQEKGIDASTDLYFGIIAPQDIPEDRLEILHEAFKSALEDPQVREQYEAAGINVSYAGPQEFEEQIINYSESTEAVLRSMDLLD